MDDFVSRLDDLGMDAEVRLFQPDACSAAAHEPRVEVAAEHRPPGGAAFVKLKVAKLVVVTRRGEQLADATSSIIKVYELQRHESRCLLATPAMPTWRKNGTTRNHHRVERINRRTSLRSNLSW